LIFVTVGSQMPFRRLVQAVDDWAGRNRGIEVIAQVGLDEPYEASNLQAFAAVPPDRYAEIVSACDLVVGHAGMGTVLTALEFHKPMVLMPRRHALRETRNDHQVATLRWLGANPGIYAAEDELALKAVLDTWRVAGLAAPSADGLHSGSTERLITALKTFIG
jgi:UDP-N-acetylglucosamine transferase subunit ALG13